MDWYGKSIFHSLLEEKKKKKNMVDDGPSGAPGSISRADFLVVFSDARGMFKAHILGVKPGNSTSGRI